MTVRRSNLTLVQLQRASESMEGTRRGMNVEIERYKEQVGELERQVMDQLSRLRSEEQNRKTISASLEGADARCEEMSRQIDNASSRINSLRWNHDGVTTLVLVLKSPGNNWN